MNSFSGRLTSVVAGRYNRMNYGFAPVAPGAESLRSGKRCFPNADGNWFRRALTAGDLRYGVKAG